VGFTGAQRFVFLPGVTGWSRKCDSQRKR